MPTPVPRRPLLRQHAIRRTDTKRIDDASGTENLSQKRQVAATLIYLGDRRQALVRELAKDGKTFKRDRDCRR